MRPRSITSRARAGLRDDPDYPVLTDADVDAVKAADAAPACIFCLDRGGAGGEDATMATKNQTRIQAAAARALIIAMGMQAENQQRAALGQSMAYDERHFQELIDENGLGWNAVQEALAAE